jgi:hypothetical protein
MPDSNMAPAIRESPQADFSDGLHESCIEFSEATRDVLREIVPRNWTEFYVSITDNFCIISAKDFRLLGGT